MRTLVQINGRWTWLRWGRRWARPDLVPEFVVRGGLLHVYFWPKRKQ